MWKPGDWLTHRGNRELGAGRVVEVNGRIVVVEFPDAASTLHLAAQSDALTPLPLAPGTVARDLVSGERVVVEALADGERVRLTDGRVVDPAAICPTPQAETLFDRLARGDVDPPEWFTTRVDALRLSTLREAAGLGSFLGGRIELFAHQLYVAERATRTHPVRWLLADEVGLGKTVEACLILNHLLRTGRAQRVLVVAPATLTVQWLGELWRKFHEVFVLLDAARRRDVVREHGAGFNPFQAHARIVIALEELAATPQLVAEAARARFDLLVVDEAHRLQRPPGHPGDPAYRAIAPLAAAVPHALLLTATPLEDDAHGFFRLLELLRPEEFPPDTDFMQRLEAGAPLPPCTSATRRVDIGGLPPRAPVPIDERHPAGWAAQEALLRALRATAAPHAVARSRKADRLRRALATGPALAAVLTSDEPELRALAHAAAAADPRLAWLARHAPQWKRDGQRTLVFVAERESLEWLRTELSRRVQLRTGVFHEDLSPAQRDIEVAQFRLPGGPSLLISTECGGEGRNFQFCERIVLFDLPWSPTVVEQRIGRLDRIGRRTPVEIVYFRPPAGLGAAIVRLYEELGLFRQPLGGLEPELAHVEAAIEHAALDEESEVHADRFTHVVLEARTALSRVQQAAYHELHREPFRAEMTSPILARIPAQLEELTESVITTACEHLGLRVEPLRAGTVWSIELGTEALVESLPGVPAGSSFLGTFDRALAVDNESEDFFASGHPLVEGIFAHLADSDRGRIALLHFSSDQSPAFGVVAIYATAGGFTAAAVDLQGRPRLDWIERVMTGQLRSRRVVARTWTSQPGWTAAIRRCAGLLERTASPLAVAAVRSG